MAGKDRKEYKERKSSHGAILKAIEYAPKLETDLDKLSSSMHQMVATSLRESKFKVNAQGGFNAVTFGKLVEIKKDGKGERVDVALSKPKKRTMTILLESAAKSRELLRKYHIREKSPFFLNYYYTDKEGMIVAPKASKGDLLEYLEKEENIQVSEMKGFVAQIVLGLKKLHDNKLVHRDIKPQNLLVFKTDDGRKYLKIADLETIAKVDRLGRVDKSVGVIATPGYITADPKYKFAEVGQNHYPGYVAIRSDAEYYQADLRKQDIYAFGKTLKQLVKRIPNYNTTAKDLYDLAKWALGEDLMREPPDSMGQIMSDPVWGETEEERNRYFGIIEIHAVAKAVEESADTFAGSYQVKLNPEEGNAINLMTSEQQEADLLLENLKRKDAFLADLDNGVFQDKSSLDIYEIDAIKKNIDAVLEATDNFIISQQGSSDDVAIQNLLNMRAAVKAHMEEALGRVISSPGMSNAN